jgi:hypothetical protein
VSITRFFSLFWTIASVNTNSFDTNPGAIESPLIHVAIASRGEWVGIHVKEVGRECV